MAASKKRKIVPGSQKKILASASPAGKVPASERIEITLMLRPRSTRGRGALSASELMKEGAKLPSKRRYVSREDFAAQRGADPADMAKVQDFARRHNLTVTQTHLASRTVKL